MIERRNAVFRDVYSKVVIASILEVAFSDIERVADLPWGKGAFWRHKAPMQGVLGLDRRPRYGCQIGADAHDVRSSRSAAAWLAVRPGDIG